MTTEERLPWFPPCFVCGDQNACGTQMKWERAGDGVEGLYRAREQHSGFEGILHGGILAALLDECAGWAASFRCQALCITGELSIRYLRPVPTGRSYLVRGTCSESAGTAHRKYVTAAAEVVGEDGTCYATGEGKFFPMPPEMEAIVMAKLMVPEGTAWGLLAHASRDRVEPR